MLKPKPVNYDIELLCNSAQKGDVLNIVSLLEVFDFEFNSLVKSYYVAKKRANKLKINTDIRKDLDLNYLKSRVKNSNDKSLVEQGEDCKQSAILLYNQFKSKLIIDEYATLFAYVLCDLNDYQDFFNFLITYNVYINLNCRDNYGQTLLHRACKKGNVEIVKLLLTYNIEINCYDYISNINKNPNKTPLHYATKKLHYDVVDILTTHGVNMNCKDTDKKTPLHYIAPGPLGNRRMFELLISKGADINCKYKHKTLLYYAVENNLLDTVVYLLKLGANPFIPSRTYTCIHKFDKVYELPLTLAIRQNFLDLNQQIDNYRIIILLNTFLNIK